MHKFAGSDGAGPNGDSFLTQPEIVMVQPAVAALMATGLAFKLVLKSGGGWGYKIPGFSRSSPQKVRVV